MNLRPTFYLPYDSDTDIQVRVLSYSAHSGSLTLAGHRNYKQFFLKFGREDKEQETGNLFRFNVHEKEDVWEERQASSLPSKNIIGLDGSLIAKESEVKILDEEFEVDNGWETITKTDNIRLVELNDALKRVEDKYPSIYKHFFLPEL